LIFVFCAFVKLKLMDACSHGPLLIHAEIIVHFYFITRWDTWKEGGWWL